MAAFVVVTSPEITAYPDSGARLGIFPGSATPAVFPARMPFWIGYGFVPEPTGAASQPKPALDERTRFELDVDGVPVAVVDDVAMDEGRPISKHSIATFGLGLEAGWHRFSGRWYDDGALVLTSERSIEFVER